MVHPHDLHSPSEPWTIRIKKIAAEFRKMGHEVKIVYFPLNSGRAYMSLKEDGIEMYTLSRRLGILVLLRNIIRMARLTGWCDIIHFQKCYYHVALPVLISALIKNKPVHYDWDDWETKIFYYSNPRVVAVGGFIDIFEKLIPGIVDTVSVSSRHVRRLSLKRGVPENRIFPASVGADLEKFHPDLDRGAVKKKYGINNHLVLYLGQLHGAQYAELFIKAARMIIDKGLDATFMIAGDGYRLRELKELAGQLKTGSRLIFTGYVPHEEVPGYIAAADICVACFEENDITKCKSPLKIVEYLACGKAIVASNVGEVRNMAGGVAVLTKPGDVDSLANGITLLLQDHELREKLAKTAVERAKRRYNWKVTAESIMRAYDTALCGRGN